MIPAREDPLPVLAILVKRVCSDTEFGNLVHALCADLQFDTLPRRTDNGGMDRTVVVLLRRRDIILEATRDDTPTGMHDAERTIAGRDVIDEDAETVDVGKLLEGQRLRLHLAEHRIGLFWRPLTAAPDRPFATSSSRSSSSIFLIRPSLRVSSSCRRLVTVS